MPATTRQPATAKPGHVDDEGRFVFEHDGKVYRFEHDFSEVRRPGWLRANRRRDQLDLAFTIIEAVAGDDALAAIDDMDEAEFTELAKQLNAAMEASFR